VALSWLRWYRIGAGGGAVVNAAMNVWIPENSRNFLTGWGTVSFSKGTL
jgi:hypothetical protein